MDWNLVQLFVEVVDAGSMSEAARRRGVTRSSISQRLRQFELETRAQLLHRTTRDLRPTDIGLALYEHGKRIAQQFEAARHEVESLERTPSGLVRVSVPPGIGQTHLAPALIDFAATHSEVKLRVTFNNRISNLIEAGIDVALQVTSNPPEDVVARELCDVRWHFYCTPAYRATLARCEEPADLADASFLAIAGDRRFDLEIMSGSRTQTVTLAPRFISENVLFLRDCVLAGMGIALLPDYLVRDPLAAGAIVRVLPEFSSRHRGGKFFILTTPNRFPTPAMESVIALLRRTVLEAIDEGEAG